MDKKMKDRESAIHANHNFWRNKLKSTAYLRYNDFADFRKFSFHYVVLEWYFVFMKHCQKLRPEALLQFIKDVTNVNEFFPKNIDALITKYLVEEGNKTNLDYIYATMIFKLCAVIVSMSTDSVLDIERQQQASSQFELNYHYTIPFFDLNLIKLPSLGLHANFEEIELEKFSHINVLLKSLQTFIALSKRKQTRQDVFESQLIAQRSYLSWMQLKKVKVKPLIDADDLEAAVTTSFALCLD